MKRVLILTLSIGNGHKAKANALHDYLKDMDVKIIDIFSNKIKGNKIYLYCLNHKLWLCVKMIIKAKSIVDALYSLFYQSSLEEQILEYKPDTIINTTPMMSGALSIISKKHNLKYIIAPSDFNYMDLKHWGVPRNTDNFEYWIPYAFEEEKAFFAQNNIKISITGFIVDDAFKNEVEHEMKERRHPLYMGRYQHEHKPLTGCCCGFDCLEHFAIITDITSSGYEYTRTEMAKAMSNGTAVIIPTGGATINEMLAVIDILTKNKKTFIVIRGPEEELRNRMNSESCFICESCMQCISFKIYDRDKIFIISISERTRALYWEKANVEFLQKFIENNFHRK